jgi:hypothetical protein
MGNGLGPAPLNELGESVVIDDGTLVRTQSPPPGPIGLDAKSGSAKQAVDPAAQIVAFPRRRLGQRVGDGECFTLADGALHAAGARSAGDYGIVVPDADYVWGTAVPLSDLRPGDVIQFRNYRYDREIETTNRDRSATSTHDFQERPHHTAIVERVGGYGAVTVLEQNSPDGSPVSRTELFFANHTESSGSRTVTISVQGTFWFYRPQPR